MQTNYDVIIIGAGPAGSSCAYNLQRANPQAKILLLDKALFPRYKPCGGGISPEVANYLDFDLLPAVDLVCSEVVMVANGREIQGATQPLWMVRREKFDAYLVAQVRRLGVEFYNECEVTAINQQQPLTRIITTRGEFSAQIVVLAEGGRGKLAKQLDLDCQNKVLAAMEYEHYTHELTGKLYIDFDYNDSGYAWNFPKADGLSLGIGGLVKGKAKGKVGLPHKLQQYTQQFGVNRLEKPFLHGHPIQLYSGARQLVKGPILLVGEIAGCVDPLTAEGIRPAIKSGYLAAAAINQALIKQDVRLLKQYQNSFRQQIGKDFNYARIMAYFLNRNLKQILPMLATPNAINGFMDVFSGKACYQDKVNWRRVVRMVWRSIVGR